MNFRNYLNEELKNRGYGKDDRYGEFNLNATKLVEKFVKDVLGWKLEPGQIRNSENPDNEIEAYTNRDGKVWVKRFCLLGDEHCFNAEVSKSVVKLITTIGETDDKEDMGELIEDWLNDLDVKYDGLKRVNSNRYITTPPNEGVVWRFYKTKHGGYDWQVECAIRISDLKNQ